MIITDIDRLRVKSVPTSIDECRNSKLFDRLKDDLYHSVQPGYALTAIQIDEPVRAFLLRGEYGNDLCVINPEIIKTGHKMVHPGEGCLSLPGVRINTNRFDTVTVKYIDYNKQLEKEEDLSGMLALIWQHEVDHMDGVLIIDKEYKKDTVGRNEPCPCGSGKKYKKCCMK